MLRLLPGDLRFPPDQGDRARAADYRAFLFNPATGEETDLGKVVPDSEGNWRIPVGSGSWRVMPIFQYWVLVMETA